MGNQQDDSVKGYNFGILSHRVIGAAMAVHSDLGSGFVEYTYQRALALELQHAGIAFEREVELPIFYRGEQIDTRRADFVVQGVLLLELKAVEKILAEHVAQLAMYLKAARQKAGLLLNFGALSLQIKRVIR